MHLLQKIIKADLIITAAPNAKSIGVKDGRHKNTIESKATFGWLFYCVLGARELVTLRHNTDRDFCAILDK